MIIDHLNDKYFKRTILIITDCRRNGNRSQIYLDHHRCIYKILI